MDDFEYLGEGTDEDDDPGPDLLEEPVEPGSPSLENVIFVLLGALSVLVIVARLLGLLG